MTVRVGKHPFQGIASEDDVAGEFLHQECKVGEIVICICKELVHCKMLIC